MKITKARLQKILTNKNKKQTRKHYKRNIKLLHHTNTYRNNKPFNLNNRSLKYYN